MAEYKTVARTIADETGVGIEVSILRDDERVATFAARYPAGADDAIILAEIERRIQGFVDADSNAIDQANLTARAEAVAGALTDRIWPSGA